MRVNVWNYTGYDIAAPTSGDPWNYFAVVDPDKIEIRPDCLLVGPVAFIPGQDYQQIGNGKKTSAGYFHLHLAADYALRFVGIANDEYLLFRSVIKGVPQENLDRDLFGLINGGYQDIYFTYRLLNPEDACLFWLTGAGAGRIIEL